MNEATDALVKAYAFNRSIYRNHGIAAGKENMAKIANALHALWPTSDFDVDLAADALYEV